MNVMRGLSAAPTATPGRVIVRDIRGRGTADVEVAFEPRTAFDFAISLSPDLGRTEDLPAADRRWLEEARATLPESTQATREAELFVFVATLAALRPDVEDAASVVELARATPGRELAEAIMAEELRDPAEAEQARRALEGDPDAIAEISARWGVEKGHWVDRLLADPDAVAAEIRDLLAAWLPRYQEIEPRVAAILRRDVELRAADRATLGSAELIERTTNGIRWLSEPGVRRVLLAPSYLARPYNFALSAGEVRLIVYPVGDAALDVDDPLAPPQAMIRLHRALGDESRLRILRLLRDRDWYLTEIADRLELSKPTIKHHLAQLRAAGLVTLIEEGGLTWYTLRRDRLDDASGDLKRYLTS